MADGPKSKQSKGGMKTKVLAAKLATSKGIDTVIANGRELKIIEKLIDGKPAGTIFPAIIKEV